MAVAFIIGNGPSRQQVKLNKLEGTTFGCNALYRDFTPDYLVSGDAGVIKEICATGYPKNHNCIFPDWSPVPMDFKDIIIEPLREQGFTIEESNPDLAEQIPPTPIKGISFDLDLMECKL